MEQRVEYFNTTGLLYLARRAEETHRNRQLETELVEQHIDPDGCHVVAFKFPHNDVEWRLHILLKMKDTMEPAHVWLDVSYDDWHKVIQSTWLRKPSPLEQLGIMGA